MNTYPVGTRVSYRHWTSDPWLTGAIESYYGGVSGTEYVRIKRDGYRETHVLPTGKLTDPALVVRTESVRMLDTSRTGVVVFNVRNVQVLWDDNPDGRRTWHRVIDVRPDVTIVLPEGRTEA